MYARRNSVHPMKKALSLLVAFVFLQVQTWALSGGPQYGSINNSVSGTWAGTMTGAVGTGSLGLFQLGMPTAGLGSGLFAFYQGGGAFFGTMVALADGEKETMSGVFNGTMTQRQAFVVVIAGGATQPVTQLVDVASLGGQFVAKIIGDAAGTSTIGVGARLEGTAQATVALLPSPFGAGVPIGLTLGNVTLTLDGFEQSSAVTGQVSLSQITNTTAAAGGG